MDISSVTKAFQSERLIYRSPEDNDKDKEFFFKHIENDPVAKALSDPSILRPKNKKDVADFLTEFQKSVLAVVLCLSPDEAKKQNIESEEPVPIGFICIGWGGKPKNREQHRATHIGIVIADDFRNKGYGGESINWALDWAFSHSLLRASKEITNRSPAIMRVRCALCGINIPSIHQLLADEQQRPWWRMIFAVQREEGQSHFSLTPLGYSQDGSLEPHPVIQPNQGFFIHQACWPIYRDKMLLFSPRRYKDEQILQVFFDLRQSMPSNGDGLISYLRPHNQPALSVATFAGRSSFGWEFLKADPSISPLGPTVYRLVDGGTYTQVSSDVFTKLSTELNHEIINLLNNGSFLNLRLASKTIANLSKPADLPQTFWASRFSRDHEMRFFPLEYDRKETWRDLYFSMKHALKDRSKTAHALNRLRIWKGLEVIAPCMVAMLEQSPRLEDTASCREELVSLGYDMTQKVQGFGGEPRADPYGDVYVKGSRYLNLRGGAWFSVSIGELDGRPYICSFRVMGRDHIEKFRIGLVNKAETRFLIKPSDQVTAVKVATTFGGIVGLAFRIKDELGGVDWKIVGKVDEPDDYVGIKLLKPQNGPYIMGLLLGLDACKVVTIQLVEKPGDATAMDKPKTSGQHVWHPAPPQPDVVTMFPPTVDETAFMLNMDFGGPSGSLLPLLTRVAVFHDDLNYNVRGLGFYYTDGTEREFGFREVTTTYRHRGTAIELSLPIDGPAGERIIGLGYSAPLASFFRIIASFGKTTDRIKPMEDPENPGMEILVSPHGETVTGFLGQVRMIPLSGYLESLGLVHLVHLDHLDSSRPVSPSTALNYLKAHEGQSTFVRLNNVKRVGISCGREGRSRRPEHVSGFRFDFWDQSPPVYAGQWFREIGHLDVCEAERITGITFWNAVHGCAYHNGRNEKYSGVRIEKSGPGSNAVEVHPGPEGNMHESCYTENRFEGLDSFAWDVFHEHDSIKVEVKPTPLAKRCLSRMSHIREGLCTKSDKIFWEIEDGKGGWTSVSQIAAFFNPDTKGLCGLEFTYKDNSDQARWLYQGSQNDPESQTIRGGHRRVNWICDNSHQRRHSSCFFHLGG
ncbi:hypothetical protein FCIRC_7883 [Fusarium circinatum]|uniref:N-acetyltransferase domain-containing protein n=1 Tax=Fusarium circinatum TaxID=48490 RepID=A0A8H5TS02_FUSCI|nr:hypothetical protein FCIRC_7883 [Fusarium circinatum]